jgi:hypothetical protein
VAIASLVVGRREDEQARMRLVVIAASLGTVFEWYDFFLYGSLAVFFSALFFPPGNSPASHPRGAARVDVDLITLQPMRIGAPRPFFVHGNADAGLPKALGKTQAADPASKDDHVKSHGSSLQRNALSLHYHGPNS